MKLPNTLFYKTASTLALSLLLVSLITLFSAAYFIVVPVVKRSANDVASFLILAAQTWDTLPKEKRDGFSAQLMKDHGVRLRAMAKMLEPQESHNIFIYRHLLLNALTERLGSSHIVSIGVDKYDEDWAWVSLMGKSRTLQFGLSIDRVGASPPVVLLLMASAIFILVIATSLILAQRLSRPLSRFSQVTNTVAKGEITRIDETQGSDEIIFLAKKFNKMSQEVYELLQNRTTLLAGISHDLRTPLTRIRLALELKNGSNLEILRHDLEVNIDQMELLIERALLLAKGIDNKEPLEQLDLVNLLSTLCAQFEAEWLLKNPNSHSAIIFDVAPSFTDTPILFLPKQSLIRVLSNLIENALRYGDDKPVEVKLSKDGIHVCISIADQGISIPQDKLESVFRPFYRLENSRNQVTGGTGLGLAIVKQLCDGWGWTVLFIPKRERGNEIKLMLGSGTLAVFK